MGTTSLPLAEDVKDRLSDYRRPEHESWSEVLDGLMERVPNVNADTECVQCGKLPSRRDAAVERQQGYIEWLHVETPEADFTHSNWYCSVDCLAAQMDERDAMVPTHPDRVVVGGDDEMETVLGNATFHLDRETASVGVEVPGAFTGESSHDYEYDYVGEPIYVINEGKVRFSGIVSDIINEETWTGLTIDQHPSADAREMVREHEPAVGGG